MRSTKLFKVLQIVCLVALSAAAASAVVSPTEEAAKLLPDRIGSFQSISRVRPVADHEDLFNEVSAGERDYQSARGERLTVKIFKSSSDSGAYARVNAGENLLGGGSGKRPVGVGTLGVAGPKVVYFFKGSTAVEMSASTLPDYSETLLDLARQLADTLEKGEGEIPALVKHLPGWQSGNLPSSYFVTLAALRKNVPDQPIFDAIRFNGGVEAAAANYGPAQLVIVEFNTPQLATDNDQHIKAKLQELGSSGPAPTAYRRVGNYAVFVFNAPTQEAAHQLIDQVKYQQVVQWLGEDPFAYERATKEFTETTLGVFVSVVKASGLALAACLAVGGFFGAVLFSVRRSQQRAKEAYADSDAMLRLNLDDLTPERDPARLLGRGH